MNMTITREDCLAYLAYREFEKIVTSDLNSVVNKRALRYGLSFDAKRLYPRVVEMVQAQADAEVESYGDTHI